MYSGEDSGLDSVGKLVSEQNLGNRLHYCMSILLTQVLSSGMISRTYFICKSEILDRVIQSGFFLSFS